MMTSEGLCLKPSDWSPLMAKRVEKPRRICEDDTKWNHKLKKLSSPCNPPQQPYPGSPLIIFHVYRHCPSSWRELLSPCSSALHSQWHDTLPLASYPLPLHSFFTLACTFATLLYWCAQFLPHSSLLPSHWMLIYLTMLICTAFTLAFFLFLFASLLQRLTISLETAATSGLSHEKQPSTLSNPLIMSLAPKAGHN